MTDAVAHQSLPHRRRHGLIGRLMLASVVVCAGCQTYESAPLDSKRVNEALTPPQNEQLQKQATEIHHPQLAPLELHPDQGLTPDEAAVIAVIINPSLRAQRTRRATAQAELLQAGILPNPQLSYNYDFVTGGDTRGTVNAYGLGLSWEITSLITQNAKVEAAKANERAVELDVAWQEWQIAQAARTAVFDLLALEGQLTVAGDIDQRLQENLKTERRAVEQGLRTAVDLAAAEAAARDAHATWLQTQHDVDHQRLALNRALGLPADAKVKLRDGLSLPSRFDPPPTDELLAGLEQHRIDLLGLKSGYDSQEKTLLAAVQAQFPKISIGFNHASDTTDVHTSGPGISIDLPIFDRNQGAIATETATRQRLFDEYVSRVFDARADVAQAISDIRSLNTQIADAEAAIPSLQHLVDVYKDASEHGNADVLSYYTAWNSLAQKNVEVLKLKQQLAANRVALEIASGRYFPDQPEGATRPPTPGSERTRDDPDSSSRERSGSSRVRSEPGVGAVEATSAITRSDARTQP